MWEIFCKNFFTYVFFNSSISFLLYQNYNFSSCFIFTIFKKNVQENTCEGDETSVKIELVSSYFFKILTKGIENIATLKNRFL